ncbi:hypothetical protein DFH28DRAFT_1090676 [Melampsora americana]|nr:hypothetical protein DFH28DRAFT_1090676 [Melampsora americana]
MSESNNSMSSIILPKRLHRFLPSHQCKEIQAISKYEFFQIIDIFHPNLSLPLKLRKGVVMRLYDMLVSPFFSREEIFDVDTNTFHYNPALQLCSQDQLGNSIKALVLPSHLIKFMKLYDPAENEVDGATRQDYHQIINLFYPQLHLPLCLNKTEVKKLFSISVLPYLKRLEESDEDIGELSYAPFLIEPKIKPKKLRVKAIYLPRHLHCFLAYKDPAVTVVMGVDVKKTLQIIDLFHSAHELTKGVCKGARGWQGLFEMMVLPYLRNLVAFDVPTSIMRYVAVPL